MEARQRDNPAVVSRAVVLLAGAFAAQAVILSLLRGGTSWDGAEQLLYTQVFDWGYGRSQPPLYTWILIAVQQVLGVSQIAENALKFALLFAGFLGIRTLSLRLGHEGRVATATMLALFMVAEVGLESQRNYAHTVLLFALMTWTAVVYLRLLSRPDLGWYALLGMLAGLMLLGKYNSLLFLAALIVADLSMPGARALMRRHALVSLFVAVAVVLPHGIWALGNPEDVFALTGAFVPGAAEGLQGALRGAGLYLLASVSLYALTFLVLAGAALLPRGERAPSPALDLSARVLLRWGVILWVLGLLLSVATAATEVRMRWLVPVCVPLLPVFAGAVLSGRARATAWVLGIGVVLGAFSIAAQWVESTRINARTDYDYAALAAELEADGLPSDLIAPTYPELANLRLHGPRSFATPAFPQASEALSESDEATLVWTREAEGEQLMAYARSLGFCPLPEGRQKVFHLERRHSGEALRVIAFRASRAACTH